MLLVLTVSGLKEITAPLKVNWSPPSVLFLISEPDVRKKPPSTEESPDVCCYAIAMFASTAEVSAGSWSAMFDSLSHRPAPPIPLVCRRPQATGESISFLPMITAAEVLFVPTQGYEVQLVTGSNPTQ